MTTMDMRLFAANAGTDITLPAGAILFQQGDAGDSMYVVQSGVVEVLIGDRVVETCREGNTLGFISIIDGGERTATARVREAAKLSIIDRKRFQFMVAEIPNFSQFIMESMARRIRGLSHAI